MLRVAPKDAVAVPSLAATAACLATWAGGLLFGGDGVTGLRFRHARGCLPRSRDHLGRHDSFGFDQGLCSVPSCSATFPKVSRSCRPAVFDAHAAGAYGPAHGASVDPPPPPEMRRRGQSVPAGASPRTSPECVTIPEAAPGRRQPQATAAAPVPDSRRLSGCPVWPRWLPTHRPRAAPNGVSVPLAPRRHQNRMFSSLAAAALHADLAPRHYRKPAPARAVAVVVTGRMPHRFATGTSIPSPDARAPVRLAHPAISRRRPLRNLTPARTASSFPTTRTGCPTKPSWAPPAASSREPGGHRHEHHIDTAESRTSAPGRPPCRSVANLTGFPGQFRVRARESAPQPRSGPTSASNPQHRYRSRW